MNKRIIALSLYLANLSQVHGQPIEFGLQWDVDPVKTQKIIEVIQKSSAFFPSRSSNSRQHTPRNDW